MRFRTFMENAIKRRITAPIGSEWLEHLVKVQPIQVDYGTFKETWYLFFTQWQSSNIDKEGGGGRILVSPVPETNDFDDGGVLWGYQDNQPVIVMYYLDQYSKIAEPFLADACKKLKITSMLSDSGFSNKYGFTII